MKKIILMFLIVFCIVFSKEPSQSYGMKIKIFSGRHFGEIEEKVNLFAV